MNYFDYFFSEYSTNACLNLGRRSANVSAVLDLGKHSANIRQMFVVRLPRFRKAFAEYSTKNSQHSSFSILNKFIFEI